MILKTFPSIISIVFIVISGIACEDTASFDSDGDGWTDRQEELAGTDSYSMDTDSDGYFDSVDPNPVDSSIPPQESKPPSTTITNSTQVTHENTVNQERKFLLTCEEPTDFTKFQGIAAQNGIKLELGDERYSNLDQYSGVIVLAGEGNWHDVEKIWDIKERDISNLLSYVNNGDKLVFFVAPNLTHYNNTLQDTFRIVMARENITPANSLEQHIEGSKVLPLWNGLIIGSINPTTMYDDYWGTLPSIELRAVCMRSYFISLDPTYDTTTMTSDATGKERITSIQGNLGEGEFIFLTGFSAGSGTNFRHSGNILTDDNIDFWDNEEAARRLLLWLANE